MNLDDITLWLLRLNVILLVVGLIKPVVVLWWLSRVNRLVVLKYYLTSVVILWVMQFLLLKGWAHLNMIFLFLKKILILPSIYENG